MFSHLLDPQLITAFTIYWSICIQSLWWWRRVVSINFCKFQKGRCHTKPIRILYPKNGRASALQPKKRWLIFDQHFMFLLHHMPRLSIFNGCILQLTSSCFVSTVTTLSFLRNRPLLVCISCCSIVSVPSVHVMINTLRGAWFKFFNAYNNENSWIMSYNCYIASDLLLSWNEFGQNMIVSWWIVEWIRKNDYSRGDS